MRRVVLTAVAGATLAALSVGSSLGQATAEFSWTPDIDRGFYGRVTRERIRTAPPTGFNVTVGAAVPAEVELYEVPADVEWAPVRRYRYTVHQDRVYVVDPGSRKVVRIINK